MAFPRSGFSREMGPSGSGPRSSATHFGSFPRPSPSQPPSNPPPPPLFGASPVRSPSPRRPEIPGGTQLLPSSFDNGYRAPVRPYTSSTAFRPNESLPRLGGGQNSSYKYPDAQISQRPSSVASLVAARNQGIVTAGIARSQDPRRSNLPVTSPERDNSRNFSKYTLRSCVHSWSSSPHGLWLLHSQFLV